MTTPVTRYATTADGLSIAYQDLAGSGPAVLWITGTASHVELFWELPGWAHAVRRLSSVSRFIWFDKRGAGLSERTLGSGLIEDRMEDIRSVLDATGVRSAVLIASSEGGAIAAVFAATHPERVTRLVIIGAYAHFPDLAGTAELFEAGWGDGWILETAWAQGMRDTALLGRIERAMGTPSSMAALIRANAAIDVRAVLPLLSMPVLVVHCTGDPMIAVEHGREVAGLVPGSRLVEIDATFHASARPEDMDLWVEAVEEFVVGAEGAATSSGERVLSTVLFTDIVGSTAQVSALGDARWSSLLDEHDRICARAVAAQRGRVVKSTGDGLLATFDGPATAIAAAHQMIDHLDVLGLRIRAGVHTGEVERRGSDIGGIGVHVAARVMGAARPGEVWVSSTVPGLTVGADLGFVSCGAHELKGVPGSWELFVSHVTG